jgi:hypothetical protein
MLLKLRFYIRTKFIVFLQMRNEIQKAKHKLDGDLRCSQEAALELERSKSEVQQAIQRKDKEFAAIQAKIEDEQGLGSKLQKQVKELGVSFECNELRDFDEKIEI